MASFAKTCHLCTHYGKEQFLSSVDSSINKLSAPLPNVDGSDFAETSVRHPQVLGCPLNATGWLVQATILLKITTQLVDDIGHRFSYIL